MSLWKCKAAMNAVPDYSKLSEWHKSLAQYKWPMCILNLWKVIQSNCVQIEGTFPAFFSMIRLCSEMERLV